MKNLVFIMLGIGLFWLVRFLVETVPIFVVFGNKVPIGYFIYPIPVIVVLAVVLNIKIKNK